MHTSIFRIRIQIPLFYFFLWIKIENIILSGRHQVFKIPSENYELTLKERNRIMIMQISNAPYWKEKKRHIFILLVHKFFMHYDMDTCTVQLHILIEQKLIEQKEKTMCSRHFLKRVKFKAAVILSIWSGRADASWFMR